MASNESISSGSVAFQYWFNGPMDVPEGADPLSQLTMDCLDATTGVLHKCTWILQVLVSAGACKCTRAEGLCLFWHKTNLACMRLHEDLYHKIAIDSRVQMCKYFCLFALLHPQCIRPVSA